MADEAPHDINVIDRRWWARGETAAGAAGEPFEKPTFVQELEARLAAKDEELRATLTRYREANAEFEQARARLRRDVAKDVERGTKAVLADLLDVVDNLDRAIEAARTAGPASALLQGVEMVRAQFLAKLDGHGVRPLDATGRRFDPALHEAATTVPVSDPAQDGIVLGVIRQGYTIRDEVLRPAVVAVAASRERGSAIMKTGCRGRRRTAALLMLAASSGEAQTAAVSKGGRVDKSSFGTTKDGQAVDLYTLTNAKGVVAKIITYGALLTELRAPDRAGTQATWCSASRRRTATKATPLLRLHVGRVGNRIAQGQLQPRRPDLHAGDQQRPEPPARRLQGFDKVIWRPDRRRRAARPDVHLHQRRRRRGLPRHAGGDGHLHPHATRRTAHRLRRHHRPPRGQPDQPHLLEPRGRRPGRRSSTTSSRSWPTATRRSTTR